MYRTQFIKISVALLVRSQIRRFICRFLSFFLGDLLTSSNSVSSRKEVITTSTGKEYIVERSKGNFASTGTIPSPIVIEDDDEVL
jgi:hypothetical protein